MKKLIMSSCLLFTSSVFAASCNFILSFNDTWQPFTDWIVTITDVSNPDLKEVVGGPSLWYGVMPGVVSKGGKPITVTVPNCTNSTQIGLFAHKPGAAVPVGTQAPSNNAAQTSFQVQAWASNVLVGMAHCVGDIAPADKSSIPLTVGNPSAPGDFVYAAGNNPNGSPDAWTKAQLGVTCQNPHVVVQQGDTSNQ